MRTIVYGFLILFCAGSCHSQMMLTGSQKAGPIAMTVGAQQITVSELCTAIESLPPPQRTGFTLHPELAAAWLGPLVAVAQEATREHLAIPANPPSEVDRDNALAGAWIEATARNFQPTDQEIETYYKAHNSEFEQAKARHILISYSTAFASLSNRSEADAKMRIDEIARQLQQGIQFPALAIRHSDDPYTREIGGDLGYVSHHQLEPALDEAIWSQAPGQVSASFRGRFGYEIVQVEQKRIQPLATVRETIIGKMKAAALERKQHEIVAAVHFGLTPAFANSPLPCQPRRFTLTDSLREP